MQHVEFFHKEHFSERYHRVPPSKSLAHFIDFFWETDFEGLWKDHPDGFSDALFPNIGYTYLINLGTPFVMQVKEKKFEMRTDGFLPRLHAIECYHRTGNQLFGIKFKISPVLFISPVNFSEYRNFIYPLSYLMEQSVIDQVKKASSFEARVELLDNYFQGIVRKYSGSRDAIRIVSAILHHCDKKNDFNTSVEDFASQYRISARTLHRYFETVTSLSAKKALQILRIRKAADHLANDPESFHYSKYGYYDHSHFYKHLRQFVQKETLKSLQPHLVLLQKLHKKKSG
jgi:AraC-like DNA-binding protein